MSKGRTARIAADHTHMGQASAQRTIREWNAAKEITRRGHVELLCEPVFNCLYRRASVYAQDRLQKKYDRGID
ncbi:MAG: hypothetical protein VYA51_12960 [Planctomycetota bacterium]|nr:hypothetical protein [Planctomycetota bacterium]